MRKSKISRQYKGRIGQLWERRMLPHMEQQESQELTEDEKAAMRHRYEITRAIYHITSVEVLNYIHIIVAGVYKDIQKAGAI